MLWVNDYQDGQGAGVQDKKGWEVGFAQPGKEKENGDMTNPFHLARKVYREDGTGKYTQMCTVFEQDRKDTSCINKNSSLERKIRSPWSWCSTKTGPRASGRCPPVKTLKIQLDKALTILHYLWSNPAKSRALRKQHPTVSFQSEILQSWPLPCLPGKCWGE